MSYKFFIIENTGYHERYIFVSTVFIGDYITKPPLKDYVSFEILIEYKHLIVN